MENIDFFSIILFGAIFVVFIWSVCVGDRKTTYVIQKIAKDKQHEGMYIFVLREEHEDTDKNDRVEYVSEWLAERYKVGDYIQFQ